MVVEDQAGGLGEVERVGDGGDHVRGRDGSLGEAAEEAERGDAVSGLSGDPSGAETTVPPTSLPGTKGRSGLNWYSPRVWSTSGNDTRQP